MTASKLLEDSIFKKLRFNQKWIELGIVNEENFIKLKERYLTGEDPSIEHYRWEIFVDFLRKNKHIPQELLYEIYFLGKNDPDLGMGRSMRFQIVARENCPKEVIELAIEDDYKGLSKHALKVKEKRKDNTSS